jgi:hypothetical protein
MAQRVVEPQPIFSPILAVCAKSALTESSSKVTFPNP